MKQYVLVLLSLASVCLLEAQDEQSPKFYIGVSYGTSFALGDFEDTDISNPDAGFARDGRKIDLYGGIFLNEKVTLTGTFRYQFFETEIVNIVDDFNAANPGANFMGVTEDWQAYYLLVGIAYQVKLGKKANFFPRVALGPLVVTNPGIEVIAPNAPLSNNFSRSSETGVGVGYEIGIGLRRDLGRHFTLLPTFSFSGGWVTISDVVNTRDNIAVRRDYQPEVHSFTLGLSLAYRFY